MAIRNPVQTERMYTQADIRNPVHTGGPRSISKKAIRSFPEACRSFLHEPIQWLREDAHDSESRDPARMPEDVYDVSRTNPLDSGSGKGESVRSR